jgi:glutaredoxin
MGEQPPDVRLFTQAGCAGSRKVRAWLAARGVAFVERNVTGDPDAAKEPLATGHVGTPLLLVGGEPVVGFQPDQLAAALADGTLNR